MHRSLDETLDVSIIDEITKLLRTCPDLHLDGYLTSDKRIDNQSLTLKKQTTACGQSVKRFAETSYIKNLKLIGHITMYFVSSYCLMMFLEFL